MEIHLADQKIKRVHKIWERPQLQPQPLWHGPPPDGVKKIFTRRALAAEYYRYCKWASNCALLTNEFLAEVYARHRETYEEPSPRWLGFPYSDDSYRCVMGNNNL